LAIIQWLIKKELVLGHGSGEGAAVGTWNLGLGEKTGDCTARKFQAPKCSWKEDGSKPLISTISDLEID
jgi:hypothetical protein